MATDGLLYQTCIPLRRVDYPGSRHQLAFQNLQPMHPQTCLTISKIIHKVLVRCQVIPAPNKTTVFTGEFPNFHIPLGAKKMVLKLTKTKQLKKKTSRLKLRSRPCLTMAQRSPSNEGLRVLAKLGCHWPPQRKLGENWGTKQGPCGHAAMLSLSSEMNKMNDMSDI